MTEQEHRILFDDSQNLEGELIKTSVIPAFKDDSLVNPGSSTHLINSEVERLWAPLNWISKKYGLSEHPLQTVVGNVPFIQDKGNNGHITILYQVTGVIAEIEKILSKPKVDRITGEYIDNDQEHWACALQLAQRFGISLPTMQKRIEEHEVRSIEGRDRTGHKATLYNLSDCHLFMAESISRPRTNKADGIYTDEKGVNWVATTFFNKKYGFSYETIKAILTGVACIEGRNRVNEQTDLYNLEEAEKIIKSELGLRADKLSKIYRDVDGDEWLTAYSAKGKYKIHSTILAKKVKEGLIRTITGRSERGASIIVYNLADIKTIIAERSNNSPPGKEIFISPEEADKVLLEFFE